MGGTVAADYLTEQGLQYVNVASAEEGCDLVSNGDVQAMVFDAPTLQYLAAKRGNGVLLVVGPIFAAQKYGIAVPDGSPCVSGSTRRCSKCTKMGGTERSITSGSRGRSNTSVFSCTLFPV